MQSETERTFRNLKVIGSLKQNDKLITESSIFEIHPPTMTRSVYRIWKSENREENLNKILACVREAKNFIEKTISTTEQSESFQGRLFLITQDRLSKRMLTAIEEVVPGLTNFSVTYKDDAGILAKIDLIIEEIKDFVTATKILIQSSNESNTQSSNL